MHHTNRSWSSRALQLMLAAAPAVGCDEPGQDEAVLAGDEAVTDRALVAELEPNNTPGSSGVRTLVLGDDNRGKLSPTDTVDYWRLDVKAGTYVNIFLGDIPVGSDYDLALIRDGVIVWSGTAPKDQPEMVLRQQVMAGVYVLKVHAYSNPQGDKDYLLRVAATAVSKALQWVNVDMQYCGAPNGQYDSLCGGTCERTGDDASPEWDPYRTDCSGYISWAWGIAPPGLTTPNLGQRFAPIKVTDLQPGDILSHAGAPGHAFLFERWVDKAARRASILEQFDCDVGNLKRDVVFTTLNATNTATSIVGDSRAYTAMRYKMP